MSLNPDLKALADAVLEQTAIIDAELADPTKRLRDASTAMKSAVDSAVGFTVLGIIDSWGTPSGGAQVINMLATGPSNFSVSQVLVSKPSQTDDPDSGTITVTTVSDHQIVGTISGGWAPTAGHVLGLA